MSRIFISYRRDDSLPYAGRIYDSRVVDALVGVIAKSGDTQIAA